MARRLASAAGSASSAVSETLGLVKESETFQAARRATASGFSRAAESVGQSQVASGLQIETEMRLLEGP